MPKTKDSKIWRSLFENTQIYHGKRYKNHNKKRNQKQKTGLFDDYSLSVWAEF